MACVQCALACVQCALTVQCLQTSPAHLVQAQVATPARSKFKNSEDVKQRQALKDANDRASAAARRKADAEERCADAEQRCTSARQRCVLLQKQVDNLNARVRFVSH